MLKMKQQQHDVKCKENSELEFSIQYNIMSFILNKNTFLGSGA